MEAILAQHIYSNVILSAEGWVQQAKLTTSDGAAGDNFGSSVSLSGDCAIVGARFADVNGVETGAAYIFRRSNTPSDPNWYQEAKLTAPDGAAGDAFGASVCVSGDNTIVGACQDDNANGTDSGSAYVFKHNGCSWTEIPGKLTASDGIARDGFGASVSISGDHAIVGAYHFWHPVNEYPGSAYIFKRFGENWIEVDKLTASDAAARDEFGISVSVSGNYGAVGAMLDDDAGTSSGSAYIFGSNNVDPNDWHEQTKLTALDADAGDVFGHSVSICGNYAIVGAHRDEDSGTDSGSAYIFKRDGESWIELAKLIVSDGAGGEYFGISVSISNHYAVVGACLDDNENGTDCGSAYIFENICEPAPIRVPLDIKPRSCPNPLNVKSEGVLPVAVLGTDDFDVNTIDIASIRLEGVAPIRSSLEDVATPVSDGNECDCNTAGPDGYTDVTLKFKTVEIVAELLRIQGQLTDGEQLTLTLTGDLSDDTPIEGTDCVVVAGKVPKSIAAKIVDVNADGIVNMLDMAILAKSWLESSAEEN